MPISTIVPWFVNSIQQECGPLHFICYINELPNEVNSTVKLHANDILLYRAIYSKADYEILQKDLDVVNQWAKSWQMAFNLSKCELVQITNKKNPWVIAITCKKRKLKQPLMKNIWV